MRTLSARIDSGPLFAPSQTPSRHYGIVCCIDAYLDMPTDSQASDMDNDVGRPDIATRFKPGNQTWKARSSHGRKPKFTSPDELWDKCCEYFEWVNENPLKAVELVKYRGVATTQVELTKMRPKTMTGLCTFLYITEETWRSNREKTDFLGVTTRVESIIWQLKFEGIAAGLLNPNIIARELGFKEISKVST